MRELALILIFSCPLVSHAGCEDIADLRNNKIYIDISDGGCAHETLISFTTKIEADGNPDWDSMKSVPFYNECTMNKDGYSGFTCKPNGISPLAGATYKLIKYGKSRNYCDDKNELGNRFVCIKGCDKPTVPKYLNGSDGSC